MAANIYAFTVGPTWGIELCILDHHVELPAPLAGGKRNLHGQNQDSGLVFKNIVLKAQHR